MRKLVVLLLALCLICGAWTAVAEEEATEIQIGGFLLQIPAYEGTFYGPEMYDNVQFGYFSDSVIRTETLQNELPSRIRYEYLQSGNWISSEPVTRAEAAYFGSTAHDGYFVYKDNVDIGLYNGEPACVTIWVSRYTATNYFFDMSIFDNDTLLTIRKEFRAESNSEATEEGWLDYLVTRYIGILSFASPYGMTEEELAAMPAEEAATETAPAETAEKQEIQLDGVILQVPAGTTEVQQDYNLWLGIYENYSLIISVYDWRTYDPPVSQFTDGNIQVDSMYGSMVVLGFDSEVSIRTINYRGVEEDIGMLNGDPVLQCWVSDKLALCSHYYRNYGVLIQFMTEGGFSEDEMLNICDDIMLSLRIVGVSEEEMIADSQADYVVVTADSGKIRTEPSISGGLIKTAYKGETYELIEESGDWYVIDVDGRTGYLHTGVAEIQ